MKVAEATSRQLFNAKNINDSNNLIVLSKRRVPFLVTQPNEKASVEPIVQLKHYDTRTDLDRFFCGERNWNEEYDVLLKWIGFDVGDDETEKQFDTMQEDLNGAIEDV